MTDQSVSSAYIAEQLSGVASALATLEQRAEELAFAAVSGDVGAVTELSSVNAEIERARADVLIFQRAMVTAERIEAEAAEVAASAQRAEHRAEAARQAKAFIGLIEQADAAVDSLVALVKEIAAAEAGLLREARAAGALPNDAAVGRSGVVTLVLHRLHTATGPRSAYRDNPPAELLVRRAWAFLSEASED